jgi:hypothetical protein
VSGVVRMTPARTPNAEVTVKAQKIMVSDMASYLVSKTMKNSSRDVIFSSILLSRMAITTVQSIEDINKHFACFDDSFDVGTLMGQTILWLNKISNTQSTTETGEVECICTYNGHDRHAGRESIRRNIPLFCKRCMLMLLWITEREVVLLRSCKKH